MAGAIVCPLACLLRAPVRETGPPIQNLREEAAHRRDGPQDRHLQPLPAAGTGAEGASPGRIPFWGAAHTPRPVNVRAESPPEPRTCSSARCGPVRVLLRLITAQRPTFPSTDPEPTALPSEHPSDPVEHQAPPTGAAFDVSKEKAAQVELPSKEEAAVAASLP